jgi:Fe-S-cluster-containing hydrogenase component 2
MRIFTENNKNNVIGLLKVLPNTSVEHYEGKPSKWIHIGKDGMKTDIPSSCIHCKTQNCFHFDNHAISSDISAFSFDRNLNVCPVGAMSWDNTNNVPIFDNDKCIKCGICARMCPVGAIYFAPTAKLSSSDAVELVPDNSANQKKQAFQLSQIKDTFHIGYIFKESNKLLTEIYSKLDKVSGNVPNLIARNLLIALGNRCAISRVGDVYTRLDALLETKNRKKGVVEVEFGRDTLDAVRGILDDIAVANCRYGISKENNLALVVCLRLPNERQGFWQVVKDINKVEKIKVNTVTIGALLILMWNFQYLNISETSFYIDFDNMSIREKVDNILDSDSTVNVYYRKLGILEPEK